MIANALRMISLPWLPAVFALTYLLTEVSASGTLKLKLLVYVNSDGRDADGGRCDTTMGIKTSDCDPYFKICIRPSSLSDCTFADITTGVYRDSNRVVFGVSLGNSIANPIILNIQQWPTEGVTIKIQIYDEDSRSGHDYIDTLTAVLNNTPAKSAAMATTRDVTARGRTTLYGQVTMYCDNNWYGNQCESYCMPRDDGTNGHYACSDRGKPICHPGYRGPACKEDIDECASNPCHNHGQCTNLQNAYNCRCYDGYTGSNCEEDIDECLSDPCLNGGSCTNLVNGFSCACAEGYTGARCDDVVDYCAAMECLNEGVCLQVALSARCQCASGFTGDTCQTDIDDCADGPCEGDGSTCTDLVDTFSCTCGPGRTGQTCADIIYPDTTASPPDPCESNPCTKGTCIPVGVTFTCHCPLGISGPGCDVDPCSESPCHDDAVCTHADNNLGYTCPCQDGTDRENCTSSTQCLCINGGRCEEGNDVCACPEAWTGRICDVNVTSGCMDDPCLNKGQCQATASGFTCSCLPGFTGDKCDVTTSRCVDEPCQHGGVCYEDTDAGYICMCGLQYEGKNCESVVKRELVLRFVGTLDQSAITSLEVYIISLISGYTAKPAGAYQLEYHTSLCQDSNGTHVTIFTFQVVDDLNDVVPWYLIEQIMADHSTTEIGDATSHPIYNGTDCLSTARIDQSRSPYPMKLWPLVVGVVAAALVVGIIAAVIIAYKRKSRSGRFDVVNNPLFDEYQTRRGTTDTTLSVGSDDTPDMDALPVYFQSASQEYPGTIGLERDT